MKPVYAHEIEPGIVVLQSESGDYFKILKEYDMKAGNLYGSLSCTKPEMTQPSNHEAENDVRNSYLKSESGESREALLGGSQTSGFNSVELSGY